MQTNCCIIDNIETKAIRKDGNTVRFVGTVRYASIFAKKYDTLVRYAFFVMVRVRYVGTLLELKISDFSYIAPNDCIQSQKQLKPTLNVWIEIADL